MFAVTLINEEDGAVASFETFDGPVWAHHRAEEESKRGFVAVVSYGQRWATNETISRVYVRGVATGLSVLQTAAA